MSRWGHRRSVVTAMELRLTTSKPSMTLGHFPPCNASADELRLSTSKPSLTLGRFPPSVLPVVESRLTTSKPSLTLGRFPPNVASVDELRLSILTLSPTRGRFPHDAIHQELRLSTSKPSLTLGCFPSTDDEDVMAHASTGLRGSDTRLRPQPASSTFISVAAASTLDQRTDSRQAARLLANGGCCHRCLSQFDLL